MIKNRDALINNGCMPEIRKIRADMLLAVEGCFRFIDPYKSVKNAVEISGKRISAGGSIFATSMFSKIYLIAFGKASTGMSDALLSTVDVDEGIVVSIDKKRSSNSKIQYIQGGHPLPNENSLRAGKIALEIADKTTQNDLTFVLISGGGSALLESTNIPLVDLQKTTELFLTAGADIKKLNTIRKHLSQIKGGRLLERLKGKVVSLIISDVVDDRLDVIASGPTYFDNTTFKDAYNLFNKYDLLDKLPGSVKRTIDDGLSGRVQETLKEQDYIHKSVKNILILTNRDACMRIAAILSLDGYNTTYLGSAVQGEAKKAAKIIGNIAIERYNNSRQFKKPSAFIFGGETTVTVRGNGKGGRNQEFVLAAVPLLSDSKSAALLSIGTDGIDGNSSAAGAICDNFTMARAKSRALHYKSFLADNDSYHFFGQLNDLIITGSTGTNIADIGILVVSS